MKLKATRIIPSWAKHPDGTPRRFTLLGRAILLIAGELLANAVCWIAAGICFKEADGLLGLALLAWTIGLRHGLDADHISAIDNATRQLVSLGQLPITCGLFFSLGHSTIVIVVNVAIAISVDIYDKLDKVGSVGGIIGASVSSSFLFLIACINIYFLIITIRQRRAIKRRQDAGLPLEDDADVNANKVYGGGCMVRIIRPVLRAVDRSWKMYPVGILFGFGFDTASSIALLAISAIAQRGPNGKEISHGKIVILPFTAGMSLVDSLDSILMLYAYATPSTDSPEGKLSLLQDVQPDPKRPITLEEETVVTTLPIQDDAQPHRLVHERASPNSAAGVSANLNERTGSNEFEALEREDRERLNSSANYRQERIMRVKTATMSNLSIILTLMSIVVALSISLITMMGLIGENCAKCTEAAEDPDGGGLAGSWWRAWFRVSPVDSEPFLSSPSPSPSSSSSSSSKIRKRITFQLSQPMIDLCLHFLGSIKSNVREERYIPIEQSTLMCPLSRSDPSPLTPHPSPNPGKRPIRVYRRGDRRLFRSDSFGLLWDDLRDEGI
uniref:High-affinity nickel-transporter n=1 Tax=Kwoniella dejecticola CBS 10117 TaxID=1296121 RepID=A0A1A6A7W6_9TREE|nr:high-affinity nickel-transporter [Kwoniella dejecticola CBS 10117]OBR86147.1 high-affinity nickel-transporter [Kwoniella dejecticola CBS 10117]